MKIQTKLLNTMLVVGLAGVIGCGGSDTKKQKLYKVSGQVVFNGNPVKNATVTFHSKDAARAASGVTNDEGKFQLTTNELNDGAIAGEHTITVVIAEEGGGTEDDPTKYMNDPQKQIEMARKAQKNANKKKKTLIPAKYGQQNTSPLKKTVAENDDNNFVLQLTK